MNVVTIILINVLIMLIEKYKIINPKTIGVESYRCLVKRLILFRKIRNINRHVKQFFTLILL